MILISGILGILIHSLFDITAAIKKKSGQFSIVIWFQNNLYSLLLSFVIVLAIYLNRSEVQEIFHIKAGGIFFLMLGYSAQSMFRKFVKIFNNGVKKSN